MPLISFQPSNNLTKTVPRKVKFVFTVSIFPLSIILDDVNIVINFYQYENILVTLVLISPFPRDYLIMFQKSHGTSHRFTVKSCVLCIPFILECLLLIDPSLAKLLAPLIIGPPDDHLQTSKLCNPLAVGVRLRSQ